MKRMALLLIFIFGFLLIQAQQKIEFLNKSYNGSKSYSLPLSVTCTFQDGSKKRLILENVIGDSLVFKKYYNQNNFDCRFGDIKKISVHKRGEYLLYGLFGMFSTYTLFLGYASYELSTAIRTDIGDPVHSYARIAIVATIISGTASFIFLSTLPKKVKSKTWKIHVK